MMKKNRLIEFYSKKPLKKTSKCETKLYKIKPKQLTHHIYSY